jgi:hypothetical protein
MPANDQHSIPAGCPKVAGMARSYGRAEPKAGFGRLSAPSARHENHVPYYSSNLSSMAIKRPAALIRDGAVSAGTP